jgi:hypothetical protein
MPPEQTSTLAVRTPRAVFWRRAVALAVQTLAVWRERIRHELMTLLGARFDFKGMNATRGLALRESVKFPWRDFDKEWQEIAVRDVREQRHDSALITETPRTARAIRSNAPPQRSATDMQRPIARTPAAPAGSM